MLSEMERVAQCREVAAAVAWGAGTRGEDYVKPWRDLEQEGGCGSRYGECVPQTLAEAGWRLSDEGED